MKRFFAAYYLFAFCHCFGPITLFYGLMMEAHSIAPFDIGIVVFTGALTGFLLEVPSGTIADRFSYRSLLVSAQLIRCLAFSCILLLPNLQMFAITFFLLSFKEALVSGTTDALLFETLKRHKEEYNYVKYYSYEVIIRRAALIISALLGAVLLPYGFQLLIIVSLISSSIGVVSALLISEVERKSIKNRGKKRSSIHVIISGLRKIRRNKVLAWHVCFNGIIGGLIGSLWSYWSIFGDKIGLQEPGIGLFPAAINLCGMLAGLFATRFRDMPLKSFFLLCLFNSVLLGIAAALFSPVSGLLVLTFMFVFYYLTIMNEFWTQNLLSTSVRATVTSMAGLLAYFVQLVVALPFGLISSTCGYQAGFLIIAGLYLLAITVATGLRYTPELRIDES